MTHPLVDQLRFTRSEFRRGLKGLAVEEARKRILPMNCIAWNVGHLAWHEQRYFLKYAQEKILFPEINKLFAYGAPASTPDLEEMWSVWTAITRAADPWLDTVDCGILQKPILLDGHGGPTIFGSMLQRVIYHYWYHTGENMAIRQSLGHGELPQFVGDIDHEATYRPEA
jgi:hypothetical protein